MKEQFNIQTAMPDQFSEIGQLLVDVYSNLDGFPGMDEQPEYYEMLANVGELTRKTGTEILIALSSTKEILGAVVYFGDMKHYGSGGTATGVKNASGFRLLGVSSAARGLGVGRALAKACIEQAKARNHSQVVIHTTDFMQAARNLYEQMGFERSADLDFVQEDLKVYGFRLKF